MANILGENLGTQQFINRLVNEKPTLARRIYYWVVDKLAKLDKSHKNERLYWANVRNKYIQAYGKEYAGKTGKAFSIAHIVGEKADYGAGVYLDTDIFDGLSPRDWNTIVRPFVYEKLAGQTTTIYDNEKSEVVYFGRDEDRARKKGAKNSHKVLDELARKQVSNNTRNLSIIHIGELAEISKAAGVEDGSHGWLDENGLEKRTAYVMNKNGNIYEVYLYIGNGGNGKTLYDISIERKIDSGVVPSLNSQSGDAQISIYKNIKPREDTKSQEKTQDNEYLSAVEKGDTSTAQSTENNTFKLGNRYASIKQEPNYDDLSKYQVIGIRTVPYEQSGKYKIGDYVDDSYDWDSENEDYTQKKRCRIKQANHSQEHMS